MLAARLAHAEGRAPCAEPPAWRSTVAALLLGFALRAWFVHHDRAIGGDSQVYGAIATHLVQHGVYGYHANMAPTLIRLPGYPLFLAACFLVFGIGHYTPVLWLQVGLDLLGCWLLSRLAALLWSSRAGRSTLWLAALCPFTASYTAAALTETLELFATTVALFCLARGLGLGLRTNPPGRVQALQRGWLAGAAAAWIAAALLRPDGALLGLVLCPAIALYTARTPVARQGLRAAVFAALVSLLAFVPWTIRNWQTFHVFQPLAPRYATDPGEPINPGFQQWTSTVCADFACTAEVYWLANDDRIELDSLPARAFDSPVQHTQTAQLLAAYNRTTTITPEMDARFAALARQRLHDHPIRYRVELPLLRLADMWFRPRIELFNIDLRWWRYASEGPDTIYAYALALLNLGYIALAVVGARRRPPLLAIIIAFTVLRCALLLTIEAPETRYILEWYPMLELLGGIALARGPRRPPATA